VSAARRKVIVKEPGGTPTHQGESISYTEHRERQQGDKGTPEKKHSHSCVSRYSEGPQGGSRRGEECKNHWVPALEFGGLKFLSCGGEGALVQPKSLEDGALYRLE